MSSKSTLLLTEDNEHIYSDCNSPHYDKGKWLGDSIILEFDKKHIEILSNDDYDLVIELKDPSSEIYKFFKEKAPEWESAKDET